VIKTVYVSLLVIHKTVYLGSSVSFIIPRSGSSSYVIGHRQTVSSLDWENGKTEIICEVDQGKQTRFNDAKCDVSGRLWAGDPLSLCLLHVLCLLQYKQHCIYYL